MATQFSWIPFYRELTQRLLTYEDKQEELIQLMEEMRAAGLPMTFLEEDLPGGGRALLTVMEPFTFMMNLNITSTANQLQMCLWLKQRLQLGAAAPSDCNGLPTFVPIAPWFFWSADKRQVEDVPRLWLLARAAWDSDATHLDPELFRQCRHIKGVGLAKLTTGLFWFSPNGFLPLAGPVPPYLKAHGVSWNQKALEKGDLEEYRSLINKAHELDFNHAALMHQAWQWSKTHPVEAKASVIDLPDLPLNTILYGPPGTGKTFSSVARAVEIIDGTAPEERIECMARFEELRAALQIGFVTFHQSFSYEEFIEGLRPVLNDDSAGGARYAVRDGIFKDMALRALGSMLEPAQPGRKTFNDLWNALVGKVETDPHWRLPGRSAQSHFALRFQDSTVIGENIANTKKTIYRAATEDIEKVYAHLSADEPADHSTILKIIRKESWNTTLIGAIVEELRRMEKNLSTEAGVNVESVEAGRSFLRDSGSYRLRAGASPRFVLIVDEINRGNISKIFGELITLLEEDKRLGKTNRLRVILPYSGETFALPPNLYLLGTMNTADKSLALVDVALRRRFAFKELNPNFSVCKLPDDTMQKVLEELNRRIMLVLDREHRIGHAFFMGVKTSEDFNKVFADKIVPLLQEYFYNDWEGLRSVLGEKDAGEIVGKMAAIEGVRGRNHYAWWLDLDHATPDFLAVLCKNFGVSGSVSLSAPPSNSGTDEAGDTASVAVVNPTGASTNNPTPNTNPTPQ